MKIKRLPNRNPVPIQPDFGFWIKKAREECGLSQLELSELLGLKSATAVSLYENNKRRIDSSILWGVQEITGVKFFSTN